MGEVVASDQNSKKPFLRQSLLTAGVSINIIAHGCAVGFPAILIPGLRLPSSDIHATPSEESWIASVVGFALLFGNLITTLTVDVIGRKKTHLLTVLPIMIGWIILILAHSVTLFIIARICQGIAMGMNGLLASMIIAEMTDPKHRGPFLALISVSLSTGVLFSHSVGSLISWRMSAFVCSLISLSCLPFIIYSPESPSWLIKRGRFEESEVVFFWLRGTGERQINELREMITAQKNLMNIQLSSLKLTTCARIAQRLRRLKNKFKKPDFCKPVFIMVTMYTMFQFSGVNVISSYALDIIENVVGPKANSKVLMVALDIERVICNFAAVIIMRFIKRRTLLFSCGGCCVIIYAGKAAYLYLRHKGTVSYEIQWLPIVILCLYVGSLFMGLSAIPFAISGEIFPLEHRSLGGGVAIIGLSMNFFLAVKCFPFLIETAGAPITYCIYATVVSVSLIILWFMLPETKDRTLQDIENSFRGTRTAPEQVRVPPSILNMKRASSHIIA